MARINGVNSDYQFIGGAIQEVDPEPEELYMKIYICPYRQPNALEPLESASGRCEGIDTVCPNQPNPVNGHAMILLHETEGIKLAADQNNHLTLDQAGNISLSPSTGGKSEVNGAFVIKRESGGEVLVSVTENKIFLKVDGGPKVSIDSSKLQVIKQGTTEKVIVDISNDNISLEVDSGAKVSLKQDGNIDLFTQSNSGTVTIHGNLHVTGTIT